MFLVFLDVNTHLCLQGSALTGPALTPAEVLVAIHDVSPDKDGLPLKKVLLSSTSGVILSHRINKFVSLSTILPCI